MRCYYCYSKSVQLVISSMVQSLHFPGWNPPMGRRHCWHFRGVCLTRMTSQWLRLSDGDEKLISWIGARHAVCIDNPLKCAIRASGIRMLICKWSIFSTTRIFRSISLSFLYIVRILSTIWLIPVKWDAIPSKIMSFILNNLDCTFMINHIQNQSVDISFQI